MKLHLPCDSFTIPMIVWLPMTLWIYMNLHILNVSFRLPLQNTFWTDNYIINNNDASMMTHVSSRHDTNDMHCIMMWQCEAILLATWNRWWCGSAKLSFLLHGLNDDVAVRICPYFFFFVSVFNKRCAQCFISMRDIICYSYLPSKGLWIRWIIHAVLIFGLML